MPYKRFCVTSYKVNIDFHWKIRIPTLRSTLSWDKVSKIPGYTSVRSSEGWLHLKGEWPKGCRKAHRGTGLISKGTSWRSGAGQVMISTVSQWLPAKSMVMRQDHRDGRSEVKPMSEACKAHGQAQLQHSSGNCKSWVSEFECSLQAKVNLDTIPLASTLPLVNLCLLCEKQTNNFHIVCHVSS